MLQRVAVLCSVLQCAMSARKKGGNRRIMRIKGEEKEGEKKQHRNDKEVRIKGEKEKEKKKTGEC